MKRAGFLMETVTTAGGKKEQRIEMHEVDGITYVTAYKGDRLIPIPYEFLVCFVTNHLDEPKPAPNGIAALEKLIIDTNVL